LAETSNGLQVFMQKEEMDGLKSAEELIAILKKRSA